MSIGNEDVETRTLMRAITLLAIAALPIAVAIGAPVTSTGPGAARAQETAPPPAAVPGPLRPIAAPPVPPGAAGSVRRAEPSPRPPTPPAPPPPLPPAAVLEGAFRPGAAGEKAEGRAVARLAANELRLEKLAVTPGRDLELWLVAVERLRLGEDLSDTKHVSLGRLKKATGDQAYRLPPEIDLRVYGNVVVWSRRERSARAYAALSERTEQRTVKQKKRRTK
jgi:hypothetical protein